MDSFSINSNTPPSGSLARTKSPASGISSDFETFLKMLTVQMQNQNPLEPIEASDFAVQLATFASVEQQVKTNELISKMAMVNDFSNVSSWLGKSVLTNAPVFVDGSEIQLVPKEQLSGTRADLIIRDTAGNELRRINVNPQQDRFSFNNLIDISDPLPEGIYRFFFESFNAGQSSGEIPANAYARVNEARIDPHGISLVLSTGRTISQEDILGVRE